MKPNTRANSLLRAVLFATVLSLLAAACGSDGPDTVAGADDTTTTEAPADDTTTEAPADDTTTVAESTDSGDVPEIHPTSSALSGLKGRTPSPASTPISIR